MQQWPLYRNQSYVPKLFTIKARYFRAHPRLMTTFIALTTCGSLTLVLQVDKVPPKTQKKEGAGLGISIQKRKCLWNYRAYIVWGMQQREEGATPNRLKRFQIPSSDISCGKQQHGEVWSSTQSRMAISEKWYKRKRNFLKKMLL